VRMTAHRPAETLREPVPGRGGPAQRGLPYPMILSMCDDLLGEVGRRDHIFAWLRAPGAAADEWLPVDAYYPRARLVVICRSASRPHDAVYRELVPAHGSAPQQEKQPPTPEWTPVKVEHTSVPRGYVHGAGVLAGLALAALVIAELYLGVIVVAFHDNRLLFGLAIALEACSRILGTLAAERAGQRGWAFACAIVGAPAVAWFALLRPSGRLEVEPAPLAGLLAVLSGVVAVVGILVGS